MYPSLNFPWLHDAHIKSQCCQTCCVNFGLYFSSLDINKEYFVETFRAIQIGEARAVKVFRKIPFVSALFFSQNFPGTHVTVSRGGSSTCWAVLVVTPILRRFQELELARKSVSVDSTASCDATNAPSRWCCPCRSIDPQ